MSELNKEKKKETLKEYMTILKEYGKEDEKKLIEEISNPNLQIGNDELLKKLVHNQFQKLNK